MQQGRLAACHAFGLPCDVKTQLLPYGIYTIPEISMVGPTEQDLMRDQVPYEVGMARYQEIARGKLIGDEIGLLKRLFHKQTRQLLGVHGIGEGATELIHIGQAVMIQPRHLQNRLARKLLDPSAVTLEADLRRCPACRATVTGLSTRQYKARRHPLDIPLPWPTNRLVEIIQVEDQFAIRSRE